MGGTIDQKEEQQEEWRDVMMELLSLPGAEGGEQQHIFIVRSLLWYMYLASHHRKFTPSIGKLRSLRFGNIQT